MVASKAARIALRPLTGGGVGGMPYQALGRARDEAKWEWDGEGSWRTSVVHVLG